MRGIVSFDMDMTLLDHKDFKIPESAIEAVKRLRKNYYIVIATGRDMDNRYSLGLADEIQPDAVIHLNGTKITVGETLLYEHRMDRELVRQILEFAEGKDFSVGLTDASDDYYVNPEFVVRNDIRRFGESGRNFKDPKLLLQMPVRTLVYLGQEAGAKSMEEAFPQLKLPMFSSREGADIVEKQASKAEGLKRLCDYYGVSMADTVAFGDSMNDYEIIQQAGIGVAMGNAIEQLKEAADYVTTAVGENGIWYACCSLKLIDGDC